MRARRQVQITTPHVIEEPTDEDSPSIEEETSDRPTLRHFTGGLSRPNTQSSRARRRSASAKKKKTISNDLWPRILIAAAALVVLAGGSVALYFSNAFPITNVTVAGNSKLQSGYVIKLADVPENSTFFRADVKSIRERLLAEPWIQDASVERGFPDTIVLRITEQPIAAVVSIVPETAIDKVQQWVIAPDGTWIAEVEEDVVGQARINAEELLKLPKIKDISAAVRPEPGLLETDEGINNALALLAGFSPEMRAMVSVISAPDAVKTSLTLSNNVSVAFGAAEDIELKERTIATLLAEHEGTITSINVRVADRPSVRTTEQQT